MNPNRPDQIMLYDKSKLPRVLTDLQGALLTIWDLSVNIQIGTFGFLYDSPQTHRHERSHKNIAHMKYFVYRRKHFGL